MAGGCSECPVSEIYQQGGEGALDDGLDDYHEAYKFHSFVSDEDRSGGVEEGPGEEVKRGDLDQYSDFGLMEDLVGQIFGGDEY